MPDETVLNEARRFSREILPRVSRTFALNIELLPGSLRECVRLAYLLCRTADTLEDVWTGAPERLDARFGAFLASLEGDRAAAGELAARATAAGPGDDLRLVRGLPSLLDLFDAQSEPDRGAIAEGVRTMAEGMRRYAVRAARRGPDVCYLDDEAELHDYCWVVAGCVGVMLTSLFEHRVGPEPESRRRARNEAAPAVGEALQLTNILLDWPSDVRRGRCHLPASWLAPLGLTPASLATGGSPAQRELALRLEGLAHAALDRVADYLDTLPPWHVRYRVFCLWPALWARASLHLVHRDPTFPAHAKRPKLSRAELWSSAARSLLVVHSHRRVRRLLAGASAA